MKSLLPIAALIACASAGMSGGASALPRAPSINYTPYLRRGRAQRTRGVAGSKLAKQAEKGLIGISRIR
jgi:hypothetical protein